MLQPNHWGLNSEHRIQKLGKALPHSPRGASSSCIAPDGIHHCCVSQWKQHGMFKKAHEFVKTMLFVE
jgi:hypothetical protein